MSWIPPLALSLFILYTSLSLFAFVFIVHYIEEAGSLFRTWTWNKERYKYTTAAAAGPI